MSNMFSCEVMKVSLVVSAKGETATFNLSMDNDGDWVSLLADIHGMLNKYADGALPDMSTDGSDQGDLSESMEVLKHMEEQAKRDRDEPQQKKPVPPSTRNNAAKHRPRSAVSATSTWLSKKPPQSPFHKKTLLTLREAHEGGRGQQLGRGPGGRHAQGPQAGAAADLPAREC